MLKDLRQVEVQAIGAAISTRNWQELERAYNSLRDKIDAELTAEAQKRERWKKDIEGTEFDA